MTYWNDNGPLCFLDNDIESGAEYWSAAEVNSKAMLLLYMIQKQLCSMVKCMAWLTEPANKQLTITQIVRQFESKIEYWTT